MAQPWIEFTTGLLTGGLALSACWGLFWLAIGAVGCLRGTCGRRVLLNSLVVSAFPLLFMAVLMWMRDATHAPGLAFAAGLSTMPLVLVGFGLRRAPDGQRAGAHMLGGVRHLMDQLLGKHQACGDCGGCGDGPGHGAGGCG
jgi:hypothetical protein